MAKHTRNAWSKSDQTPTAIVDWEGYVIAKVPAPSPWRSGEESGANLDRIIAAVNFVDGIETKDLTPDHKHMTLAMEITSLAQVAGVQVDANPHITLERVWDRLTRLVDKEAADLDDEEFETNRRDADHPLNQGDDDSKGGWYDDDPYPGDDDDYFFGDGDLYGDDTPDRDDLNPGGF